MLRSARHGSSLARHGVLAAVTLASGVAMVAGLATGASATDRGGSQGGDRGGFSQNQTATRGTEDLAVGLYVYLKQDPTQHAYWENSTQQYLVRAWVGDKYGSVTVEEAQAAVEAAGLEVCGPGEWGVQQDKIIGGVEVFTDNPAPSYPKSWIGWVKAGGNIYEAAHWNLDDMVEVPECGAQSPTPAPTPTASVPTPSATQTAPAPAPTTPPVTVPTESPAPVSTPTPVTVVQPAPEVSESAAPVVPAPTSTPTADVVTVVLPAPSSVETKAPEVVTEVLAAGSSGTVAGAQLASTGAAPVAGAIAAVLLLAAGGVLLVLRRRGATR